MLKIVEQLIACLKSGHIEIYNEFSLQHEIGILMRQAYPERIVQFERNVSFFLGSTRLVSRKRKLIFQFFLQLITLCKP